MSFHHLRFFSKTPCGMTAAGDPKQGQWPTKGNSSPQRDNRQPTQGPRGTQGIFGFGENPFKTSPWEGLGGNWYTQKFPGYHTNHSPRKKSWVTSWGTNPFTESCFSGPLFGSKKGPRAFLAQDVGSGLQKWGPGSKISKLRVEKPCRIQWSMPQMGPYVQVMAKNVLGVGVPN